eukprot:PhM_4_TR10843/c0_g1_i1/m.97572
MDTDTVRHNLTYLREHSVCETLERITKALLLEKPDRPIDTILRVLRESECTPRGIPGVGSNNNNNNNKQPAPLSTNPSSFAASNNTTTTSTATVNNSSNNNNTLNANTVTNTSSQQPAHMNANSVNNPTTINHANNSSSNNINNVNNNKPTSSSSSSNTQQATATTISSRGGSAKSASGLTAAAIAASSSHYAATTTPGGSNGKAGASGAAALVPTFAAMSLQQHSGVGVARDESINSEASAFSVHSVDMGEFLAEFQQGYTALLCTRPHLNGTITRGDIVDLLELVAIPAPDPRMLEGLFQELDVHRTGKVSWETFLARMNLRIQGRYHQDVLRVAYTAATATSITTLEQLQHAVQELGILQKSSEDVLSVAKDVVGSTSSEPGGLLHPSITFNDFGRLVHSLVGASASCGSCSSGAGTPTVSMAAATEKARNNITTMSTSSSTQQFLDDYM